MAGQSTGKDMLWLGLHSHHDGITFSWVDSSSVDAEPTVTKDPNLILKRWTAQAAQIQF